MDGGDNNRMKYISPYNSWVGHTPMFNDDVSKFSDQFETDDYLYGDPGLSILTSSIWSEMSHHKYAPKTMQQRLRDEWSEDEQA